MRHVTTEDVMSHNKGMSLMYESRHTDGMHALHAYTPATEPYDLWKGLDRKSPEYAQLKIERSQVCVQKTYVCKRDCEREHQCTCVYVYTDCKSSEYAQLNIERSKVCV